MSCTKTKCKHCEITNNKSHIRKKLYENPFPFFLHPRTFYEWFRIWLFIMLMILFIYCIISYINQPLDESDFRTYMTPMSRLESGFGLGSEPKIFDENYLPLRTDAEIFDMSNLSSEQLLNLPTEYIPNITDFVEDHKN